MGDGRGLGTDVPCFSAGEVLARIMVAELREEDTVSTGFSRFSADDWSAAAVASRNRDAARAVLSPSRTDRFPIAISGTLPRGRAIDFISDADPLRASAAVSRAGGGCAEGITLAFAGSQHPLGGAIPLDALPVVARAVADAGLSEIRLSAGHASSPLGLVVLPLIDPSVVVTVDCDPLAALAAGGETITLDLAATIAALDRQDRQGAAACADGRLWHAGGASDAQELAAVLATLVAYLRIVPRPDRFALALAADSDQFHTIAKTRAIRLLVARVLEEANLKGPTPRLHAESAWRSMSMADRETNILRGASAAFGALVGGADTITVLPFEGIPSPAGTRLARNTIAILDQEARLGAINDPAAGSGAIEAMTDALAEAAWATFRAIERAGGMEAAIAEGPFLREVALARDERVAAVRDARSRMIGVNAFPGNPRQPAPEGKMDARLTFRRPAALFEDVS